VTVEVSRLYMDKPELIAWCAANTLNCFLYDRNMPGLSATTDQAVSSGRPLAVADNPTFRHVLKYLPPYPARTLTASIESSAVDVRRMQEDWAPRNFARRFESVLDGGDWCSAWTPATGPRPWYRWARRRRPTEDHRVAEEGTAEPAPPGVQADRQDPPPAGVEGGHPRVGRPAVTAVTTATAPPRTVRRSESERMNLLGHRLPRRTSSAIVDPAVRRLLRGRTPPAGCRALEPFAHERLASYSQHQEDLLIDLLLGQKATGFYVDVGANHPVRNSNTKRFSDRGWTGINAEPGRTNTARYKPPARAT
jgi:hypothetical protein